MTTATPQIRRPLLPPDAGRARAVPGRAERGLLVAALAGLVGLPLVEAATRPLAAIAAVPAGRHLALGFAAALGGRWRSAAEVVAGALTVAVCLLLAKAAFDMVLADHAAQAVVGGVLPLWLAEIVMPAGFALIGWRFFLRLPGGVRGRAVAVAAVALAAALELVPVEFRPWLLAPGFGLTLVAAAAGAPIFVVLGAAALLLFWVDATPIASIIRSDRSTV